MKIWFITGTSRGFGREWAKAALARGDKVAAIARNTDALTDLTSQYGKNILPIKLDVLLLGNFAADCVKVVYPKRLETWTEWEAVSRASLRESD